MIPVSDVIPSRTTPRITLTLIVINLVTLASELALPADRLREIIYAWGLIPETRSPLTLVSSLFLHAGVVQAVSNISALWIFGPNLEDRMGHGRFLMFYLLVGTVGALAGATAQADSPLPLVGASSAVAGVIGAYFVLFPTSRALILTPVPWTIDLIEVPSLVLAAAWLLLLAIGMDGSFVRSIAAQSPSVVAQVAGALVGALTVWIFRRPERMAVEWWSGPR
jgi:membrane associated rhomboid family serine protease